MTVKEKIKSVTKKAGEVATYAGVMAMTMPFTSFASNTGFNMQEIQVDVDNVDAGTIISRLLGIITGIFVVIGVFRCGTAVFSILEAYSEDNSAAINKGVKQLAIGAAFIAAPLLLKFLFG